MKAATIAARLGQALILSRGLSSLILNVITLVFSEVPSIHEERMTAASIKENITLFIPGRILQVEQQACAWNTKISIFVRLSILFARKALVYREEGRD
jgi:hypothetical protein